MYLPCALTHHSRSLLNLALSSVVVLPDCNPVNVNEPSAPPLDDAGPFVRITSDGSGVNDDDDNDNEGLLIGGAGGAAHTGITDLI